MDVDAHCIFVVRSSMLPTIKSPESGVPIYLQMASHIVQLKAYAHKCAVAFLMLLLSTSCTMSKAELAA